MPTDLIHLGTKEVCEPVDLFGKLIMHRVQTLEPVRLVSMRNMRAQRMMFSAVVADAGVGSTFPIVPRSLRASASTQKLPPALASRFGLIRVAITGPDNPVCAAIGVGASPASAQVRSSVVATIAGPCRFRHRRA